MQETAAKNIIHSLLELADIQIDGRNPWDVRIHHPQTFKRVLRDGELGLGESYVDGWWDCERVDILVDKLLSADAEAHIKSHKRLMFQALFAKLINLQTKRRALEVGKKHYDLGNTLFKTMLDPSMTYTCAYWDKAESLEQAQFNKLDLVCKKLYLKPGMRLLDIGCGWGALAKHAATHYGVEVVGITISQEQYVYAKAHCKDLPVTILFQDYRDVNETFDCISSIGMFEAVGHLNYRHYMQTMQRCLKPNGLFLLHTIGNNVSTTTAATWIEKYIFPNGMLPSIAQIGKAIEGLFIMEDWHNFGADYDKTLMAWHQNFNQHWESIKQHYDDTFFRMWNYYLLSCAGAFRARDLQLWQIVLSNKGIKKGYKALR